MADAEEGSVAPQERVNIVYRPALGNAKEEIELPLKLLMIGDFTSAPDKRPLEERQPINIDKDNFNEVLKEQHVNVAFKAPDLLSGAPDAELDVALSFSKISDFGPESVAKQVAPLKALLEVRDALLALKGPLANVPEFRNKLQTLIKDEGARSAILKEMGISEKGETNG
jgi:type VI secretion system protein ImpB